MQNESYQIVTPQSAPQSPQRESMTFNTQSSRDQYIRQQRAYGWEVFLSFQGRNGAVELYSVTRRAL